MTHGPFFIKFIDADNEKFMMIPMNSTNPEDLLKLADEHEAVARKLRDAAKALISVRGMFLGPGDPGMNPGDAAQVGAYLATIRAPSGIEAMIRALGSKPEPLHVEEIIASVKQQGAVMEKGSILSNLSRYKDLFVSGSQRGYWTLTPQAREKHEAQKLI